jgi:hypothetical protein
MDEIRGQVVGRFFADLRKPRSIGRAGTRAHTLSDKSIKNIRATLRRILASAFEWDAAIDVKMGDTLVLTRRATEGTPPRRDRRGGIQRTAFVACPLPPALEHLAAGHRVLFDDGRIHAVVERARKNRDEFVLRVLRTQKETSKATGVDLRREVTAPAQATSFTLLGADSPFWDSHRPSTMNLYSCRPRRSFSKVPYVPSCALSLSLSKQEGFQLLNVPAMRTSDPGSALKSNLIHFHSLSAAPEASFLSATVLLLIIEHPA